MDYALIALGILPSVLYALAGLLDAIRQKEPVQWALFWKTIIIGVITAGLVTQQTGDMLIALTSTGFVTYICDKILNSVLRTIGLAQ